MEENQAVETQPEVETQEVNVESESTEEVATQQTEEQIVKIPYKFNKQEGELTVDEAREYLEKGMNYDKINSKYEELSGHKGVSVVNSLAEKYGLTAEEMAAEIEESYKQQEIQKYAEDEGIDDLDKAKRYYDLEQQNNRYKSKEQSEAQKAKRDQDLVDFVDFYKEEFGKDIDATDIPKEVWEMYDDGKPMVDAFIVHQYKQAKHQEKVEQHNQEISEAAISDVTKQGSISDEVAITDEVLDNMSQADMDRRWKEIQTYLKNRK